jgi:Ankyrin repeats (3 copies)
MKGIESKALLAAVACALAGTAWAQAPAAVEAKPPPQAVALQKLDPPAVSPRFNDLMTAVIYGDRETVAQLVGLGRWVDRPDSNRLTPLMVAVHLRDYAMVRLLLESGADASLQAPGGEQALDMARASGEGAIEKLLLDAGRRQ